MSQGTPNDPTIVQKMLSALGMDGPEPEELEPAAPSAADIRPLLGSPEDAPTAEDLRHLTSDMGDNPGMDWIMGLNDAVADLLDAPGAIPDAVSGLPASPGNVRSLFVDLGFSHAAGDEPNTPAYSGGRMFGNTLPLFLMGPLGAGIKAATPGVGPIARTGEKLLTEAGKLIPQTARVAPAAPGMGPVATGGREIARSVGETVVRNPITSSALEATSATLSGIGGHVAHQAFPDSAAAEGIGYILGGLSPVAAIKGVELGAKGIYAALKLAPLTGPLVSKAGELTAETARRVRETVTVRGAVKRAIRRIEHATQDPDAALKKLDDPDVLPEAKLTPAQKTDEPLLLALEKSVIESSDILQLESDRQIAELNSLIHRSMRDLGGDPEATRETFEATQKYLFNLLDGRMRIAAVAADKRIANLGPKATAEEANLIAHEELLAARQAGRDQETELWNFVDDNIVAGVSNGRRVLKDELMTRGRTASEKDVPEYIHKFLGKLNKKGNMTAGSLKGSASVQEIRTLRSRLLADLRGDGGVKLTQNARRIAVNLEEALLADMGAARNNVQGANGEALRTAFDYSNLFNDRFSRGPVGKLLRYAKGGGEAVAPELTLETTLGMKGPKAAVNAKALIKAMQPNPSEANKVDQEAMAGAMENWIKSRFNADVVRNGRIKVSKVNGEPAGPAVDWLRANKPLLDEFPAIRADIEKAILAEDAMLLAGRHNKNVGARLAAPKISKATMFINREPGKAFDAVESSRNVGRESRNLLNMAGKDGTGEATEGLQGALAQWILKRSTITNSLDVSGESYVSGSRMSHILDSPAVKQMAEEILTKPQLERLRLITNTAVKLDNILAAKGAKEGVIADAPGVLIAILGRMTGAQAGRVIAGKLGGGTVQTPGILAGAVQKLLASRVKDPASRLIIDAITSDSDDLMKALLRKVESPDDVKFVSQRIHAWISAVLYETGGNLSATPDDQPIGP